MSNTIGVIVFPGSNCDHDAYHAMKHIMNAETRFLWHKETDLGDIDLLIIPGGFSYGDYLRSGAIARFSPIMQSVVDYAAAGKPVLGICNGFQILLESGLLPGAMLHNEQLRFICKDVHIRTESNGSLFTSGMKKGQVFRIPVSHGEGNYFIDDNGLNELENNEQIAFRYCNTEGEITPESNINGSVSNIAGITNKGGNVLGMMPHPERAMEPVLGNTDGKLFFESVFNRLQPA
ncbi:MAG: phosphoribosylformylglycinamidine synthase subunit PurQ [Balneolaceae bacterium]|nr:phosphoribosylformylglycinamidine synthase subunit PurQ [Balneolaceae bacterium]MCH8547749.1 phosphoribosylformylglycinamidine synthase subunit PurQ [Balneolaceae bacterium]